jgi:hypothetical protein
MPPLAQGLFGPPGQYENVAPGTPPPGQRGDLTGREALLAQIRQAVQGQRGLQGLENLISLQREGQEATDERLGYQSLDPADFQIGIPEQLRTTAREGLSRTEERAMFANQIGGVSAELQRSRDLTNLASSRSGFQSSGFAQRADQESLQRAGLQAQGIQGGIEQADFQRQQVAQNQLQGLERFNLGTKFAVAESNFRGNVANQIFDIDKEIAMNTREAGQNQRRAEEEAANQATFLRLAGTAAGFIL